ncbi:MAG: LacI family transcriptional regulator [Tannerellaceae bacterium]|jgi:LacI family transcriptional regulator|nr:LacI family transcriptional regulator [Tannerellaceae bacterium]
MKRVSIKDIAQAVGVSVASVSLALTGKEEGRVSKDLSAKIHAMAKKMNYQPNRLAISLQSGRSQTIGLLVTDIANPFFGSLAYHIQKEMGKAGYAVVIMNTDESSHQMGKMIDLMKGHQMDGLIIVPAEFGEDYIRQLVTDKVPVVMIDRYYPSIQTNAILIDNYDASYQATKYLISKSCKKIALLIYDNNLPHMTERKAGYADALEEAGLFDEKLIKKINHNTLHENIYDAIVSILPEKEKTDGILFATNTIALNGLKQLFKLHIKIPQDIQVVCFDKNDVLDFMPVPIPYIQQPIQSIANMASRMLLEQLEESVSEMHTSVYRLPAELIG